MLDAGASVEAMVAVALGVGSLGALDCVGAVVATGAGGEVGRGVGTGVGLGVGFGAGGAVGWAVGSGLLNGAAVGAATVPPGPPWLKRQS